MIEQTQEEREAVQKEARRCVEVFSAGRDKETTKKSPYELKMERMKEMAKAGKVLVEQVGHKLDMMWVLREQAIAEGVKIVDPIKWVTSRMAEEGRIGTIKRAF